VQQQLAQLAALEARGLHGPRLRTAREMLQQAAASERRGLYITF
jgi:hypothetical protein